MKLKKFQSYKKAAEGKEKAESVLSTLTPGLCIAFHPTVRWNDNDSESGKPLLLHNDLTNKLLVRFWKKK